MDEWSRLVGLLEGEGSFTFHYKQGSYADLRIQFGSNDEDSVDRVVKNFGGNKWVTKEHGPRKVPFYLWQTSGFAQASQMMRDMYPHLCKRRQEQIARALWNWWHAPVGNKYKVFCKNGHTLSGENLSQYPSDTGSGRRRCLTCKREGELRRYHTNKE